MKSGLQKNKLSVLVLLSLLTISSCTRCSFPSVSPKNGELTILTYNCQNFFDDIDNGSEYIEYDPGAGKWNSNLFFKKLMNIAEVIVASVQGGPDIIALQEVENLNVLETLRETALTGRGYRDVVLIPADDSAVNCGLITRFPVLEARAHLVTLEGSGYNRFILEVKLDTGDIPLIILNNHWKSKSGGAEDTEPMRIECAAFVKERVRVLSEVHPGIDIIVLGDLNENIDEFERIEGAYQTGLIPIGSSAPEAYWEKSMCVTFSATDGAFSTQDSLFFSPWGETKKKGSYMYNSSWETIDHVLLPSALFDGSGWEYAGFDVIDEEFLLTGEGRPKRWSTDLQNGYSDHLPLVLTLSLSGNT